MKHAVVGRGSYRSREGGGAGEGCTVQMGGASFNLGSLTENKSLGSFFQKPLDKLQHLRTQKEKQTNKWLKKKQAQKTLFFFSYTIMMKAKIKKRVYSHCEVTTLHVPVCLCCQPIKTQGARYHHQSKNYWWVRNSIVILTHMSFLDMTGKEVTVLQTQTQTLCSRKTWETTLQ